MPSPVIPIAAGKNYEIAIMGAVAICTVWKRPDLTREEGAQLAAEKVAHHERLAKGSKLAARAMILDLREAPASWGPDTHASIRAILAAWSAAGRRMAVITGDESVQRLLVRELLRDLGDRNAMVVESMENAQGWVGR